MKPLIIPKVALALALPFLTACGGTSEESPSNEADTTLTTKQVESWVGKQVVVDVDGDGFDFNAPYPNLDINGIFTVTADNLGETKDRSGIRIIDFVDSAGNKAGGNASRFELALK